MQLINIHFIYNIKHYVIQLLRQKLNKMLHKLYNVLKAYILNNVLKIVQYNELKAYIIDYILNVVIIIKM